MVQLLKYTLKMVNYLKVNIKEVFLLWIKNKIRNKVIKRQLCQVIMKLSLGNSILCAIKRQTPETA